MISRFKDDASLSIIGSANNTNNKGFSEFGDAGQGLGGGNAGSGITTAQSLGVNFAKDTKKLQIGGNVQYGHSDNDARRKTSSETFLGETSSFAQSENFSNRNRHDFRDKPKVYQWHRQRGRKDYSKLLPQWPFFP
jgi:hypothetical protein